MGQHSYALVVREDLDGQSGSRKKIKTNYDNLIAKGVKTTMNGEMWFPREKLFESIIKNRNAVKTPIGAGPELTFRESQILTLVASGVLNRDIADRLCISKYTVKTHLHNIYKKIDEALKLDVEGIELLFATDKILKDFRLKRKHKAKLKKLECNTMHVPFWREDTDKNMYFWNTPYCRKLIERMYKIAKEII